MAAIAPGRRTGYGGEQSGAARGRPAVLRPDNSGLAAGWWRRSAKANGSPIDEVRRCRILRPLCSLVGHNGGAQPQPTGELPRTGEGAQAGASLGDRGPRRKERPCRRFAPGCRAGCKDDACRPWACATGGRVAKGEKEPRAPTSVRFESPGKLRLRFC